MKNTTLFAASLVVIFSLPLVNVSAAQHGHAQMETGTGHMGGGMMDQDGQPIAGYKLMTPEERNEFKERMGNLDSAEQRQAYRSLHRDRMTQRARAQGMDIDDIEKLPSTAAGQEAPTSGDMSTDMNKDDPLSEGEGDLK